MIKKITFISVLTLQLTAALSVNAEDLCAQLAQTERELSNLTGTLATNTGELRALLTRIETLNQSIKESSSPNEQQALRKVQQQASSKQIEISTNQANISYLSTTLKQIEEKLNNSNKTC